MSNFLSSLKISQFCLFKLATVSIPKISKAMFMHMRSDLHQDLCYMQP